jgi:hypothetical protein
VDKELYHLPKIKVRGKYGMELQDNMILNLLRISGRDYSKKYGNYKLSSPNEIKNSMKQRPRLLDPTDKLNFSTEK